MSVHKRTYRKKDGSTSQYYLAVVKLKGVPTLTKQFDRKFDAERWEREQRVGVAAQPQHQQQSLGLTIGELGRRWFDSHAKQALEWTSYNRYEVNWRRHIEPTFGGTRAMELRPAAVEAWARGLVVQKDLNEKTANGCLMLLKKILSDAVRWQLLPHNPIAGIKAMKEPERDFEFWTMDEGERFLAFVRKEHPPVFYAVAVSLYTGMRLGEIQALKWDCIHFTTRLVTVKRTYCLKRQEAKERTKTSRIRRIPMNEALRELLIELRSISKSEYVLSNFAYHHAAKLLRRLAKVAGVKPIRFHDLRHSFASNFVMRGGQIYKLQRLLGHTSIQMTERYSHLSPDHLQDATELLDFGTLRKDNVVKLSVHSA